MWNNSAVPGGARQDLWLSKRTYHTGYVSEFEVFKNVADDTR